MVFAFQAMKCHNRGSRKGAPGGRLFAVRRFRHRRKGAFQDPWASLAPRKSSRGPQATEPRRRKRGGGGGLTWGEKSCVCFPGHLSNNKNEFPPLFPLAWHLTGGPCKTIVSFLGEGAPTTIDYRKRYLYSNLSTGGPRGFFLLARAKVPAGPSCLRHPRGRRPDAEAGDQSRDLSKGKLTMVDGTCCSEGTFCELDSKENHW